jgi:hypothetical protein
MTVTQSKIARDERHSQLEDLRQYARSKGYAVKLDAIEGYWLQ